VSQFDAVMTELATMRAENAWMIKALKYLLGEKAGLEVAAASAVEEGDLFDDENEWIAPVHAPKTAVETCTHQHQTLVRGVVRCASCGTPLLQSGVVGDPRTEQPALQAEWGQFSKRDAAMNGRFGDD